jgi:hypothetical protein
MSKKADYLKRLGLYNVLGFLIVSIAACTGSTSTPTPPGPTQTGSPIASSKPSPTPPASPSVPAVTATPPAIATAPAGNPSVLILSPTDFVAFHGVVAEQGLKIAVQTTNFKLLDKIGQASVAGEGHLIYYVDADPPTAAGISAVSAGASFITTAATAIRWGDLPRGAHKVSVQLVNNDNTPLVPPVFDSVTTFIAFAVGAPSIKIISPGIAATLPTGNVTIQVSIRDFINAYNPDNTNVFGEGHIVYYMDVDPSFVTDKAAFTAKGTYASTSALSYTWPDVKPGIHTFSVQLVNNDGTPLSAPPSAYPAVDKVEVIVR